MEIGVNDAVSKKGRGQAGGNGNDDVTVFGVMKAGCIQEHLRLDLDSVLGVCFCRCDHKTSLGVFMVHNWK